MTTNVPLAEPIERVFVVTVDCLRWDYHDEYRELYPNGVWYRGTPQATYTPTSHASLFTGLNPPRHGVFDFGHEYVGDESLFTVTDAASRSRITRDGDVIAGLNATNEPIVEFRKWFAPRLDNAEHDDEFREPEDADALLDSLDDHDVTFLHDWVVHGADRGHPGAWTYTISETDPAENHRRYRKSQQMSLSAHENLLSALRNRGLFENTLFVVWGDHGECLNEQPDCDLGHAHDAHEPCCRVPIGFCSPLFEATTVDHETNPRSVDVLPTLRSVMRHAGLRFDDPDHEMEGIDLTTFEGRLAGYTMSPTTPKSGTGDAVRGPKWCLYNGDVRQLYRTRHRPDGDAGYALAEPTDDEAVRRRYQSLLDRVRGDADTLVLNRE